MKPQLIETTLQYPPYALASSCAVIVFRGTLPREVISADVHRERAPPAL